MKKLFALLLVGALGSAAFAQSRNSFSDVEAFLDLTVNVSNGGLTYEVVVGADPRFMYNGNTYHITDVFGFWVLSNDVDFVVQNQNIDQWVVSNNNAGPGAIAGWRTNPNTGLVPGTSKTFTFDALNVGAVDQVGFHLRISGDWPFGEGGDTGFATVPEPATMLGLAGALPLLLRRRRKNR